MKDPAPSQYQSENVKVKRRIFFYDDDILCNRRDRYFKEIKGNRSIHAVMSTDGDCSLSSRHLSCYCDACLDCQYDSCENLACVDGWEEQGLEQEGGRQPTVVTRGDVTTTLESIKHLATKDSIVAIASEDRGTEYYLLQVTGDGPEVLSIEETNDWGSTYPPGAEILRGYFLVRKRGRSSPYNYELVREEKTAVYAATIRFICPELCASDTQAQPPIYKVSEGLHMDILESLHGF